MLINNKSDKATQISEYIGIFKHYIDIQFLLAFKFM